MAVVFVVFLVCAGIQLGFYLFFTLQISRPKIKDHLLDIEDKPVSVIISSHNNFSQLKNLLEKLYIQAYRNFEIVVVDDRSDDETFEYLIQEEKQRKNLKVVRVDRTPGHINEKKYALTLGIKAAKNELLLLTDSDCEPVSNNWIHYMTNQFNGETDFVLGFSYYKPYRGFLNFFIRHETLQTALLFLSMAVAGMPYMAVGRNLAYRRSLFLSKKGFKGILKITGGDDDLFVNRYANSKNTEVCIHPEATVNSEPKRNLRTYVTQKIRHLSAGKKYRGHHKIILFLFSFSKSGFWVLLVLLGLNFYQPYWLAGMFILYLILLFLSFRRISKKFNVKYTYGWVWLMDFVYISYLTVFSLTAILSKRIKWS